MVQDKEKEIEKIEKKVEETARPKQGSELSDADFREVAGGLLDAEKLKGT